MPQSLAGVTHCSKRYRKSVQVPDTIRSTSFSNTAGLSLASLPPLNQSIHCCCSLPLPPLVLPLVSLRSPHSLIVSCCCCFSPRVSWGNQKHSILIPSLTPPSFHTSLPPSSMRCPNSGSPGWFPGCQLLVPCFPIPPSIPSLDPRGPSPLNAPASRSASQGRRPGCQGIRASIGQREVESQFLGGWLVIFRGGRCGCFGGMVLGVRVPPVLGGYIIFSQLPLSC